MIHLMYLSLLGKMNDLILGQLKRKDNVFQRKK